jgi:hypothetical protein
MIFIGSDPEFLAVNKFHDAILPPAVLEEFFGMERIGTLDEDRPHYHPIFYENEYMLIGDGAAFEVNMSPSRTPEEFQEKFFGIFEEVKTLIESFSDDVELKATPTERFFLPLMQNFGFPDLEKDRRLMASVMFGCDTQFNIRREGSADPKISVVTYEYRHAGGHIHMSNTEVPNLHPEIVYLVRLCDIFLGTSGIYHSPYPDKEKLRQKFYGVPGNFRPTEYPNGLKGIEYRSPSVSWLNTEEGINSIFKGVRAVMSFIGYPKKTRHFLDTYENDAVAAINSCNRAACKEILERAYNDL